MVCLIIEQPLEEPGAPGRPRHPRIEE